MYDFVRTNMQQAIDAHHIHASPEKILKRIKADMITVKLSDNSHTLWDLLHHVLFWQDIIIESIEDLKVDWSRSKAENWPSSSSKPDQKEWDSAVKRFLEGLDKLKFLAGSVELNATMKSWPQGTKMWAIQMLAQHNSYHLGQMVTIRQELNIWPKEK